MHIMHKSVNLLKILKIGIIIIRLGRRLYRLVSVLYSAETIAQDFYAAVHRLRHYRGNAEARGINEMRIKKKQFHSSETMGAGADSPVCLLFGWKISCVEQTGREYGQWSSDWDMYYYIHGEAEKTSPLNYLS